MPRVTSPSHATDIAGDVTTPGWLVEILFTSPLRLCTRQTARFQGNLFIDWGLSVQGLDGGKGGSLHIGDPDRTVQAYLANENVEEKPIRVWAYTGDVADGADIDLYNPICLFSGYAADAFLRDGVIQINLQPGASNTSLSPRVRMTRETGFSQLAAPNEEFEFGGEKWRAEAEI